MKTKPRAARKLALKPIKAVKRKLTLQRIGKAKNYTVRLSPKQRREAVMNRLGAQNQAMGLSRTRGGAGRSKLKRADMPIGAQGPSDATKRGQLNQRSRHFAESKRIAGAPLFAVSGEQRRSAKEGVRMQRALLAWHKERARVRERAKSWGFGPRPVRGIMGTLKKAKGMIPKGGSSKMFQRVVQAEDKASAKLFSGKGRGLHRLVRMRDVMAYLESRKPGRGLPLPRQGIGPGYRQPKRSGVYKAKGLIRDGSHRLLQVLRRKKGDRASKLAAYLASREANPSAGVQEATRRRAFRVNGMRSGVYKAKPKTLYVYRPVENADAIIAWAKSQGFKTTLAPEDLHVTLAYSKTPMNWARLHDDYRMEPATEARASCGPVCLSHDGNNTRRIDGGVREVKALGDQGAVVLAFESDTLTERHIDFKRAGASWDYPSFTPHITITYNGKGVDLAKVSAYSGEIVLGEECWEEIVKGAQEDAIAREESVDKARGMLPGGSPQSYYRMRRGADREATKRMGGKAFKAPARYVRAGHYLLTRINRKPLA